jgi:competence protein ComEA
VIVDVAGWVRRPGVYAFVAGDRVIDAVERAGGARQGAALSALNLAAPLVDGSQILVPREGGTAGSAGAVPGASGAAGGLVNINTASATELEALPGIGEVLAATIVAYREEHGPFASVDQLEDVSGIGPSTLEEIRDLVAV